MRHLPGYTAEASLVPNIQSRVLGFRPLLTDPKRGLVIPQRPAVPRVQACDLVSGCCLVEDDFFQQSYIVCP